MCGYSKRLSRFLGTAAVLGLFLGGCGRGDKPGPVSRITDFVHSKLKTGAILKVEAREFTNDDFTSYLKAMGTEETKGLSSESLSRLFDRFVDEKILLEAARQRNITLTWEEKKNYLAKLAQDSAAETSPPAADATPPDSFFDRLLIEKYNYQVIRDVPVENEEVQTYYENHKKDFLLPERVQVSQILVPTEERAVAVLRKIENAPESDFRKAAREESIGPEAFKGGVMGVYKPGDLPKDMEKVIFPLDEGKISQVVESSYGYHIFRLDRKFPPQLESENEAAAAIRIKVLEQKIKDALAVHLGGLKDTLTWQTFPENLFFPYQRLDG
jgi:hypothetical protein